MDMFVGLVVGTLLFLSGMFVLGRICARVERRRHCRQKRG